MPQCEKKFDFLKLLPLFHPKLTHKLFFYFLFILSKLPRNSLKSRLSDQQLRPKNGTPKTLYCSLNFNFFYLVFSFLPTFRKLGVALLSHICPKCPCCLMFELRHCHYCSVNTHANISAIFLTVCGHGCKTQLLFYHIQLIIGLESESVLFLGEACREASQGAVLGAPV